MFSSAVLWREHWPKDDPDTGYDDTVAFVSSPLTIKLLSCSGMSGKVKWRMQTTYTDAISGNSKTVYWPGPTAADTDELAVAEAWVVTPTSRIDTSKWTCGFHEGDAKVVLTPRPVAAPDEQEEFPFTLVRRTYIKKPHGSANGDAANPVPEQSWDDSGPYRFDLQWVKVAVPPAGPNPGEYDNDIEGAIHPDTEIGYEGPERQHPITYYWQVAQGEFDPHDAANTQTLTGDSATTPHYKAITENTSINLTLSADIDGLAATTKVIQVFQDHLGRDKQNFGIGTSCGFAGASWEFTRFGQRIVMATGWNCHGSTNHACDGSGTGAASDLCAEIASWPDIEYRPPIDWADVASNLDRGHVVSLWVELPPAPPSLQHSHTSLGGATMYGANNEAVSGPETWKWDTCTSQDWWNEQGTGNPPYPDCNLLVVHMKP